MCGGAEYDCTGRRAGGARLRCRSAGTLLVDTPQQCLRRRSRHPRAGGRSLDGSGRCSAGRRTDSRRFFGPISRLAEHFPCQPAGRLGAALALLGIIGTIIEAGSSGWHAPITVCGLILGVTAGLAFIVVERTTATPVVPLNLFNNATLNTAVIVGFTVNLMIFGITFAFAFYFQRVLSFSAAETGIAFLPFALIVTAANVAGGRCVARYGLRVAIIAGLMIAAAGYGLLLVIGDHRPYLAILPGQLIIRLGIGLAVPAITTGALSAVASAQSGVASGALNAVRQTGGAVGVALYGALMATDMVRGIRIALALSSLFLLAAAIVSFSTIQVSQKLPSAARQPRAP